MALSKLAQLSSDNYDSVPNRFAFLPYAISSFLDFEFDSLGYVNSFLRTEDSESSQILGVGPSKVRAPVQARLQCTL